LALILSPSDAIAKSMNKNFSKVKKMGETETSLGTKERMITTEMGIKKCTSCNGRIIIENGCPTCQSCGLGKCD
jgi:hypothetical protein